MATTYRYLFADLRTNQILAELPLTGVSFTKILNDVGSLSAHILLSDVTEAGYDIPNSTIPARTAIYVDRDGVLVWGGIIWSRVYNSTTQTLTFSAREFESYFERRRIAVSQAFVNTDQLAIVQSLVNTAQSASGGNIGITVGTETSGVLVSRTYYSYELKDLYSAIKDLSNSSTGFDFNIDVAYDNSGTPQKYLRLDYPRRGAVFSASNPTALVFEFPGNMVEYEWPENGSLTANQLYGIGPGSNEGKLLASSYVAGQIADGWALLEDSVTYNDVYDATLLSNLTAGEVVAKKNPVLTSKYTLPAYENPVLGSFETGDQVEIRITDDRFPAPSSGGFGYVNVERITAISVMPGENGPERVSVSTANLTS